MKTGILFDLDGTLLNTIDDLKDATNYALKKSGYPQRSLSEIRSFVGNGVERLIRLAVPQGTEETDIQRVLACFRSFYDAHCQEKTAPYPGILEQIRSLEYPIAIVSNKPDSAVKILCAHYFPGFYALGETEQIPRKPRPEMVFEGMRQLGVEDCIYVGDSEVDVLTAKNAGVPCISVLWGFRDRDCIEQAGGKYFCETADRLPTVIREILGETHG